MDLARLISRYFWVFGIASSLYNYVVAIRRIHRSTAGNAERAALARRYLRWLWLGSTVPWLVMGWGIVSGNVPDVFHYFRPQDRNPHVVAFFAALLLVLLCYALWVFCADGARKIRESELFPAGALRGTKPWSETAIKVFAALGPLLLLLWIYLVAWMDAPIRP